MSSACAKQKFQLSTTSIDTHTKKDSIPEKLVLPVKRVYKNFFATSGMFKAFSIKSYGLGGHVASVSWAWIASLRLKALNDVSLVLDEIVLLLSITCLAKSTVLKDFLEHQKFDCSHTELQKQYNL